MFLVSAAEDTANTIGKLVGSEQSLGLSNLAFAMDPLWLDGVQPRALFGQKARNYAHPSFATFGLNLAVMGGYPVAHFFALVPGGVVPDQKQRLFARRSELVGAVAEKLRGFGTTVGRPRTSARFLLSPAGTARSRPAPWARDHPCSESSRGGAPALHRPTTNAEKSARSGRTSTRPQSPQPTADGPLPDGSAGRDPLFAGVFGVGALDPAFGPLPA